MRQVDDGAAEILRHGAREQPVADDDGFWMRLQIAVKLLLRAEAAVSWLR